MKLIKIDGKPAFYSHEFDFSKSFDPFPLALASLLVGVFIGELEDKLQGGAVLILCLFILPMYFLKYKLWLRSKVPDQTMKDFKNSIDDLGISIPIEADHFYKRTSLSNKELDEFCQIINPEIDKLFHRNIKL